MHFEGPSAEDALVLGQGIRRESHSLATGGDLQKFLNALRSRGFVFAHLTQLQVPTGMRMPGWIIENHVAVFGWIAEGSEERLLFQSVETDGAGSPRHVIRETSGDAIKFDGRCVWVLESALEAKDAD